MIDPPRSTSLNAGRRAADLHALAAGAPVDVLVIGGGVTGAGVALDAATRGLSTVLVERDDLASGTSRWSSKLVHGGLRYLAHGELGLAYRSAAERAALLRDIAPHLVHPLPQVFPRVPGTGPVRAGLTRAGLVAGDVLRRAARTPSATLPAPRWLTRTETLALVPALRRDVSGGMQAWDGQLVDDAAFVVALARTAAGHGARILTRCTARAVTGDGATLTDELTGRELRPRARVVINATGVWAGDLVPGVRLRPSRGTHLVLPGTAFGGLRAGIFVSVPGATDRYVFALPARDGRVYAGLTDEPVDPPIPRVPQPADHEVAFLLDTLNSVLAARLGPGDVLGAFAGLRPLLSGTGRTSDLSRSHAVLRSPDGVVTVVGGKLTTYRRMARDAVDAAVGAAGLSAGPCRTRRLPLAGAARPATLARVAAPGRLVDRYGTEASTVRAVARVDPRLSEPLAEGIAVTGAELVFGLRHEGALGVEDLLDRRTRIGLVAADRERARPAAERIVAAYGSSAPLSG